MQIEQQLLLKINLCSALGAPKRADLFDRMSYAMAAEVMGKPYFKEIRELNQVIKVTRIGDLV